MQEQQIPFATFLFDLPFQPRPTAFRRMKDPIPRIRRRATRNSSEKETTSFNDCFVCGKYLKFYSIHEGHTIAHTNFSGS